MSDRRRGRQINLSPDHTEPTMYTVKCFLLFTFTFLESPSFLFIFSFSFLLLEIEGVARQRSVHCWEHLGKKINESPVMDYKIF